MLQSAMFPMETMLTMLSAEKTRHDATLPELNGTGWWTLYSPQDVIIDPGEIKAVGTGVQMSVPHGYVLQVRADPELAFDFGVVTLGSPRAVDAFHRGEITVLLVNHSQDTVTIPEGAPLAQGFVAHFVPANYQPEARALVD